MHIQPGRASCTLVANSASRRIVVIDDERSILATLQAILTRRGYEVEVAATAAQGRARIQARIPDLVLLDLGLPDADGLELLGELRSSHPGLQVIILTAHDTLANAIQAIKLGAFHFFSKPYVPEELLSLCERAIEQSSLTRETAALRQKAEALEERLRAAEAQLAPVAVSRPMREIEALVKRIAPSEANVLITGESGVGKEVVAAQIHRQSHRAAGPMIKLNCAAFPANMIESELFGYVKGAFTGALQAFPGMLSETAGGTLFLDEITEMPPELQTRFLRVLQEREFRPLGSTKMVAADFRLIAACNQPPARALREGRLREDLYFRLKTFEIEVPPLRERREDIAKLADTFLARFARQGGRPAPRLSPEALERLRSYPWPGNVRELQNAIEHAIVLCEGELIEERHLPRELTLPAALQPAAGERPGAPAPASPASLEETERRALIEALRLSGGNKKRAAELLGIHRPTLYAKLKRHGVAV